MSGTSTLTVDPGTNTVFNGVVLDGPDRQVAVQQSGNVLLAGNQTTTSLQPDVDALENGQPLSFTASVTAAGAASDQLQGEVAFHDNGTLLGSAALNSSGQAEYTLPTLSTGNHAITAVYGGYDNFTGSSSAAFDFTWVLAAPPAITLRLADAPALPTPTARPRRPIPRL